MAQDESNTTLLHHRRCEAGGPVSIYSRLHLEVRGELAIFVVEPQPRKPELKSAIPLPVLLGDTTSSTIFELVLL
jgi:hypothetical protein